MTKVSWVLFTLLSLGVNYGFAGETKKANSTTPTGLDSAVSIQSLGYKIFDRQTGKLLGAKDIPSDPYGMHSDIWVEVKLKGKKDNTALYKIIVTVNTRKSSDEARGDISATAQTQTRESVSLSQEGELTMIPFLFMFECNPMIIKAEIPALKISKQIKVDLGCTE